MSASGSYQQSKSKSASGYNLDPYVEKYEVQLDPLRRAFLGQGLELLQTGGVGTSIPMIAQARQQSQAAASQGLRGTEAGLNAAGFGGTPYAASILGQQGQQGALAGAGIGQDLLAQFLQSAPGLVQGNMSNILGALASQSKSKSSAFGVQAQASYGGKGG